MFIAELDVDHRPIPLAAVLEGCRVPFRVLLVRAVIQQFVIGGVIIGLTVVVDGEQSVVEVILMQEMQPAELVVKVLLIIRFLREIPIDVRVGRVAGNEPAEILVVLGAALGGPVHHLVIDLDHHVGDHAALAQGLDLLFGQPFYPPQVGPLQVGPPQVGPL